MSSGISNDKVGGFAIDGTAVTSSAATLNTAIIGTAAGKKIAGNVYTVTAGDDTANASVIATGLTSVTVAIITIKTAANLRIATMDAGITWSGANITIADGLTYAATAGYLVEWIAFGT